jgi:hypothetical protein
VSRPTATGSTRTVADIPAAVQTAGQPSHEAALANAAPRTGYSPQDSRLRWAATLVIVCSIAVHAAMVVRSTPLQSANDRSRWATIRALVEDGSYRIDRVRQIPGWDSIDRVRIDGHDFSSKPPWMATWVAGVTGTISAVTGWTFAHHTAELHGATLLLVNVAPLAVLLFAWFAVMTQRTSAELALVSTAVLGFGTLLSPFLATLNNHTTAAMAVGGVVLTALVLERNRSCHRAWLIWSGWCAGWLVAHELPGLSVWVFTAWRVWSVNGRRGLSWWLPAAVLPLIGFVGMNQLVTGSWKPAYAGYGSSTYVFEENGIPSYWSRPQGIDRNLDSPAVYALHCLVGHHGLFLLSPVLLGLLAVPAVLRRGSLFPASWVWGGPVVTLVVLGFYFSRTDNYNYGGVSCALRWMIFLWPWWLLCLVEVAATWRHRPIIKRFALFAVAVSVFSAWEPAGRPWQQPWAFRWGEHWGWFSYRDVPPPFPRPLWSWFDRLPTATNMEPHPYCVWTRQSSAQTPEQLRLTRRPDAQIDGTMYAVVEYLRTSPVGRIERRWHIHLQKWERGDPPAQCLYWPDRKTTTAEQQLDLALFRGLPLLKPYAPGFERAVKVGWPQPQLWSQRAACQVDRPDGVRVRCDVWLSDQSPFGTARVDWTTTDAAQDTVQVESWVLTDGWPPPPESAASLTGEADRQ